MSVLRNKTLTCPHLHPVVLPKLPHAAGDQDPQMGEVEYVYLHTGEMDNMYNLYNNEEK